MGLADEVQGNSDVTTCEQVQGKLFVKGCGKGFILSIMVNEITSLFNLEL